MMFDASLLAAVGEGLETHLEELYDKRTVPVEGA